MRFCRDNKGLEVDAMVEARDGRWIAVEVKLGIHRVDEGAQNLLLALRGKVADDVRARCGRSWWPSPTRRPTPVRTVS